DGQRARGVVRSSHHIVHCCITQHFQESGSLPGTSREPAVALSRRAPVVATLARMAPLIVLVVATLLARLAGQFSVSALRQWPAATRVGLAVMFLVTATAHFSSMRADLVRMVPPGVPHPELMVTFTGVCEVLGA